MHTERLAAGASGCLLFAGEDDGELLARRPPSSAATTCQRTFQMAPILEPAGPSFDKLRMRSALGMPLGSRLRTSS